MRSIAIFIILSFLLTGHLVSNSLTHQLTNSLVHQFTSSPLPRHFVPRNDTIHRPHDINYEKQWAKVDSLTESGLPRSALKIIDEIYSLANSEKNNPQVVKAILYRIRLNSDFQENFPVHAIREIQKEIAILQKPVKQILHSILGELFWNYFRMNQYRFQNRTSIPGDQSDDPETWDLNTLASHIILNYRLSLSNDIVLQDIPIEQFQAILDRPVLAKGGADPMPEFRPTLFDFLAHRALDFFTTSDLLLNQSVHTFSLDNAAFFDPIQKFINNPLQPKGIQARSVDGPFIPPENDTLSVPWYAMRIFQSLDQFHVDDKNPRALIDVELDRYAYVLRESTLPYKDSLYIQALMQFEQDYAYSPFSTEISFVIAEKLIQEGATYDPLISGAHKWDLKKALQICMQANEKFPDAAGSKACRRLIKQIKEPSLNITSEYAIIPSRPALISLGFKNVSTIHFRMVKANPDQFPSVLSGLKQAEIFNHLTRLEMVSSWSVSLPSDGDYQEHQTEMSIPAVEPGFYVLFSSSDSSFQNPEMPFTYQSLWSSQISYVTQRIASGGVDVYLLNRESGRPLPNLLAEAYSRSYNSRERVYTTTKTGEYHSDASGFFSIPAPEKRGIHTNLYLKIHEKNDLLITEPFYLYPAVTRATRTIEQTRFFTDRAIYRPGQIIYFKGIMLERTGDSSSLKTNKTIRVAFTDVNGQEISEQTFTTDSYGAFNGSFIAPTGLLLGDMRIFNKSGSITVSVEEYKRPTFEVLFDPVEGSYKLGEQVTVVGKAIGYAGNAVDAGTVSYRVVRTAHFPFWNRMWYYPFPSSPETEILNGTVITQSDGSFTISFDAIPDLIVPAQTKPVFTFQVYADVTDINGETRSGQESISVGYISLIIDFEVPEKLNLTKVNALSLSTTNLNGRATPSDVQVVLSRLDEPERPFKKRLWGRPDLTLMSEEEFYSQFPNDIYNNDDDPATWEISSTVFDKVLNTSRDTLLNFTDTGYRIPDAGYYKIELSATDPFGQKVEKIVYFIAFDPDSKRVPVPETNWFVPLQVEGEPGEYASFLIGTSEKDVQVIWEIRVKDQLQSREWIKLNNQQKKIEIPILEAYRGNFSVNFLFVKDNRVYQNNQVITVPYTDKKLDITFETFRNKLIPGQHEEWKIRITNADKKGVEAQLLTTMYDRSLDLFRSNTWTFDLYRKYYFNDPWEIHDDFRTSANSWYSSWSHEVVSPREYDRLNWFGLRVTQPFYSRSGGLKGVYMVHKMDAPEGEPPMAGNEDLPPLPPQDEGITEKGESLDVPAFPIRKDFRETAFFYPSLTTDSEGSLYLKFTVPDAFTSWKLLGLGYTKQLDYGLIEKELITRKDLMVFPNPPRFLRQGDTIVFSAKIVNLSNHEISGESMLNLSEAVTLQPLDNLIQNPVSGIRHQSSGNHRSFTIPAGQSAGVSWTIAIPVTNFISLLKYRVTAHAGNFSDGEENTIPVLTNRMLVTESLPLPVRGQGTFNFTFDKLKNSASQPDVTLENYRLTLEFASNPAWYVVQALPSLNEVIYKNAVEIFGAFYANGLAAYIANSRSEIRQVFESWKALTPDALLSNLEKNEELKTAILEETPWVMEAKSETQSKRRIGLFFDMNNLENNLKQNLAKLIEMQKRSGGWPWFIGMRESRVITLNILTGLGRLKHLGVRYPMHEAQVSAMIKRAIQYLDEELVNDYEKLKKRFPDKMEKNYLSPIQIKYLYARSFYKQMPDAGYRMPDSSSSINQALQYYTIQAKKFWLKQDIYSQGMIALALNRLGDRDFSLKILQSLSEKALHSPEMGMYWATQVGYEWYRAPIETQALLIEAFDEIDDDRKSVEEMKIWLLKQKQTQMWRTRQATVDACYALLLRGTDLLANNPQVSITLGDLKIDPAKLSNSQPEAGTGYFKMSWMGDQIKPDMSTIQITKVTNGIAWGGLYWQYFENLDKITPHETPLTVEQQLFLEKNTESGPVLEKIPDAGYQIPDPISNIQYPTSLQVGDKLIVRIILTIDRNMEFVHLKAMRASGLEPLSPTNLPTRQFTSSSLSGYRYQDGLGYYQSTTDVATNFFFDNLPKGTYVFEYPLVINNAGNFSNGITTVQCMYAPEFSAHSEGIRIEIAR